MIKVERLFDVAYYAHQKYNLPVIFATKYNGKWVKTSNQEYLDKANAISKALIHLGVQPNDKIAVITTANRTEWNILDIAILQVGAQNVPIYPTVSAEEFEYIFNHSEVNLCFVSDEVLYNKIKAIEEKIPLVKDLYSFDKLENCKNLQDLIDLGNSLNNEAEVEDRKNNVKTDDLATIIYTSGTTGKPKGVMLSHKNIISNFMACQNRVPFIYGKDTALSFLPCCHVYERMLLYLYQYGGLSIYFAESIEKIGENIVEVKPHVMCVVPRLLEKVYDKIIEKGAALTGFKRNIFFWSVELAEEFEAYGKNGFWYEFKLKIARKLVLSKWKQALGGNLNTVVCGSAALQPRLGRAFTAAEMVCMEGYGLTETSPVIAVNDLRNGNLKYGTVGKPIDDVQVKIAEDGEILTKSDSVMLGYYKDPEKTAEVIKNGYFHTEDIGEIDTEGFLKITDRKKEMFKTSGGKYIAPQALENAMKASRFIEQIMVVGDGEKMPGALIQPDFNFVREWAKRKKLNIGTTNKDLVENKEVISRIQAVINEINKGFGNWEQIKVFHLTPEIWSTEAGHLTPTMKFKRKHIKEKYINEYNKMYQH
ncbi:long-chain fatty acid--CoA ligase [Paenimyroides tangerinum]|uniref:Long-chain fatty acid--CoA ligase n=1 Tax=Paenimyroides tangerinum TaxID=2488728 RepID=A0A3P3WBV7_9FLAO|nr:long-chain fatty acid--CoA ligase [Paenimyroides tangerinum]RRJ92645.1 long-chain fatty acid--CoA ligase [Paenimyroides tangerinum]